MPCQHKECKQIDLHSTTRDLNLKSDFSRAGKSIGTWEDVKRLFDTDGNGIIDQKEFFDGEHLHEYSLIGPAHVLRAIKSTNIYHHKCIRTNPHTQVV